MPITNSEDVEVGDRIRLIAMPDDPDPIPPGTEGTVASVTDLNFRGAKEVQLIVKWDNGRSLSCICPPDVVEVLGKDKSQPNTD